jgi:predicted ATPase
MFTSLRLERFKSFKDAELKLGPFTVLIGANASGKSNVRDAFRFLHGIGRGYSLADIIGEKYGEGGERVWTGIRGGIPEIAYRKSRSFTLTAHVREDEEDQQYRIEVAIDRSKNTGRVAAEELTSSLSGTCFEAKSTKGGLSSIRFNAMWPRVPRDGYSFSESTIPNNYSFLSNIYNPLRFLESMENKTYDWFFHGSRDYNEWIKLGKSMRFFEWALDAIRQPSLPGQDVLSDNGRNLSSVLQAICREGQGKRALLSWIAELTPIDAVDFEFPTDPTGKVLATLVEKNGQRITLASASDGTLRFLAFLAAFLGPHPSRFYFFEEL